jgi:hypothetical protein
MVSDFRGASTTRERRTAASTDLAASDPIQEPSRAEISPRAASSPNTAPMMAIRITRSGASDDRV